MVIDRSVKVLRALRGDLRFVLVMMAISLIVMMPRPLAADGIKIIGLSEPALPGHWTTAQVGLAEGKTVNVEVSDAVPLQAYGSFSPFWSLAGYVISPRGAAKNKIIYMYSAEDLQQVDWKSASIEAVGQSAVVFPDQSGGFNGYFVNAGATDLTLAELKAVGMTVEGFAAETAGLVAAKFGEAGPGYLATTKKLPGVPVTAKLAANSDTWTSSGAMEMK